MSEFTASNGTRISLTNAGKTGYCMNQPAEVNEASGYLGFAEMVAWREFFQHERDEELGRWRYPLDPQWIAAEGVRNSNGRRAVALFNEQTFEPILLNDRIFEVPIYDAPRRAARAFFEAHPERKPWREAKPGEVWAVTIDREEIPCKVTHSGPDFEPLGHLVWATIARGSERIETARRIWPEDAS